MAYTRLDVDERRRQLLEAAVALFTRHSYDELSMAQIAREAGISKALLYHYFPSKRDLFVATLQDRSAELAERVAQATDAAGSAPDQLAAGLDAFLGFVEENPEAYLQLLRSAGLPEVRELIEQVREQTARAIATGLGKPLGVARAWLWFLDGAIVGWLERGDLTRPQVHEAALAAIL